MTSLHLSRRLAAFAACAALIGAPAFAQSADVSLVGQVTDASTGAPLQGATVILTSPDLMGSRQTKTDVSGAYRISQLPVGTYSVLIAKGGYKRVKFVDVRLRGRQTARLNTSLSPQAAPTPAESAPAQP